MKLRWWSLQPFFFLLFFVIWSAGLPQRQMRSTGVSVMWGESEISVTVHFGEQTLREILSKGREIQERQWQILLSGPMKMRWNGYTLKYTEFNLTHIKRLLGYFEGVRYRNFVWELCEVSIVSIPRVNFKIKLSKPWEIWSKHYVLKHVWEVISNCVQ